MTENNFKIDSAAVSDRGLSKKRPQNEDSYLEMNQRGLFAVADGVGGAQAGDVASQMAMEIIAEAFNNLKPNEDAEEMMKIAIERANSAIYQMSQDLTQLSTMATTIVALHLAGNIGTIGHVGDSRLYRLDENGNLYRETLDHSFVEEEVRAGRMTVAQATNHPSRNVISRALGADGNVEVDMKTIMFEPNTIFLLCSDGITRHIDDFEIRELLASSENPAQICQKMKDICYERGAEDNLTAVIAKVSDVVIKKEAFKTNGARTDFEEATVANARTAPISGNENPIILELGDEVPTQQLKMPEPENLPPIELNIAQIPQIPQEKTPAPESFPETKENILPAEPEIYFQPEEQVSYTELEENSVETPKSSAAASSPSSSAFNARPATPPTVRELENKPFKIVERRENGGLSKLLLGAFTFLIGAIIGAGAIYVLTQSNTPTATPPVMTEKSENIPLSSFENARRRVDDNPITFIRAEESNPSKDAESNYLLGRAYMLSENFPEAKKEFEEAKNKLGETDPENATIIANDVAAYLAIIENTNAQTTFSDEVKKGKATLEQDDLGDENTNANALADSNVSISR